MRLQTHPSFWVSNHEVHSQGDSSDSSLGSQVPRVQGRWRGAGPLSESLGPICKNAFSQSIGVLRRSTRTNCQQCGGHESVRSISARRRCAPRCAT